MFKRIILFAVLCLLPVGAPGWTLAQSDCEADYSHYARAVQLHDGGDYSRALRHYRCALQADPEHAIIPLLIANVHEDIESAKRTWSRDAARDPYIPAWLQPYEMMESAPPRVASGSAHSPFQIQAAPASVEIARDERVSSAPADDGFPFRRPWQRAMTADDFVALASNFIGSRDWERAATALSKALELQPWRHDLRCQLGMVYASASDDHSALAQFDRVLSQDPSDICANEHRRALLRRTNPPLPPASAATPDADERFRQARAHADAQDWQLARDAFEAGLSLEPHRVDVRCKLGMIYDSLGDSRAALLEFERVLDQDAADSCAWSNREALLQRLRDG